MLTFVFIAICSAFSAC